MRRTLRVIGWTIWAAAFGTAVFIAATSYATGRQVSVGLAPSTNLALQCWNGRVGFLYQGRSQGGVKMKWFWEAISLHGEVFEAELLTQNSFGPSGLDVRWYVSGDGSWTLPITRRADAPAFVFITMLAVPLALAAARRRRTQIRRRDGLCECCAYPLLDLKRCPECGTDRARTMPAA